MQRGRVRQGEWKLLTPHFRSLRGVCGVGARRVGEAGPSEVELFLVATGGENEAVGSRRPFF
eukprot:2017932-Alexandrium_andersonii.AAC.1